MRIRERKAVAKIVGNGGRFYWKPKFGMDWHLWKGGEEKEEEKKKKEKEEGRESNSRN